MQELPAHGLHPVRAGPDEIPGAGGHRLLLEAGAGLAGRPAAGTLPRAGASLLRLAALLARMRPAIVNVHFLTGAVAYLLALRPIFGYRLVLSGHGGDLLDPTPGMRARLPGFLRAADAVTVVSAELAGAARAFGASQERLHLIPNGADIDFWCPGVPEAEPGRIVAVGRLLPIKGFDLLIEAASTLPDARVFIAGDGDGRRDLESRIAARALEGRVRLLGHLDPEALRAEIRRASLFAMPSRREGMPLALIEALACGTPAVAARVGGIPEVLTAHAGRVVAPDDADALRDALAAGLSGKAGLSRAAARERAEAFSDRECYGRYAALMRDLVGR